MKYIPKAKMPIRSPSRTVYCGLRPSWASRLPVTIARAPRASARAEAASRRELQAAEPGTRHEARGPREAPLYLHECMIDALRAQGIPPSRPAERAVARGIERARHRGEAIERVL